MPAAPTIYVSCCNLPNSTGRRNDLNQFKLGNRIFAVSSGFYRYFYVWLQMVNAAVRKGRKKNSSANLSGETHCPLEERHYIGMDQRATNKKGLEPCGYYAL